jgi:hypothetical protein
MSWLFRWCGKNSQTTTRFMRWSTCRAGLKTRNRSVSQCRVANGPLNWNRRLAVFFSFFSKGLSKIKAMVRIVGLVRCNFCRHNLQFLVSVIKNPLDKTTNLKKIWFMLAQSQLTIYNCFHSQTKIKIWYVVTQRQRTNHKSNNLLILVAECCLKLS